MKSNCCKAEMLVAIGEDGTNHWRCFGCNKPCDPMQMSAKKPITSKSTGISMQISVKGHTHQGIWKKGSATVISGSYKVDVSKSMQNIMVCHGDSHPFGKKCKTCDKIKKEYEISMGIKDKNSLHNRIHKEGFKAGYKKGVKDALDKYRKIFEL